MIGMIRPLVKRSPKHKEWIALVGLYGIGAITSSIILGSILGTIGTIILPRDWFVSLIIIIAVLGLLLTLSDFQIMGLNTLTTTRQTCPIWWSYLGHRPAMILWGLDIGLGFTTIRVASLYWVILLILLVLSSPLLGAITLGAYGLAITLNLIIGIFLLERIDQRDGGHIQAIRLWRPLKRGAAVILLLWSIWMLFLVSGSLHLSF